MKLFSRINRGLIVTVVVLLSVIMYLVALEFSHAAEKPKIMDACEKYIETAVKYKMLPEKYRRERPEMPQAELDQYIADMTRDLKALYIDNEQVYKFEIEKNISELKNQAEGNNLIYSFKKEIQGYREFKFDGNGVIATIVTNTSMEGTNFNQRETYTSNTEDKLTLEKVNGEWKLVYADLILPQNNMQNGVPIEKAIRSMN